VNKRRRKKARKNQRQKEREAFGKHLRAVIARLKANPNFSEPNF
jgi:hypothetical protein